MFVVNWFYDMLQDWGWVNKEANVLFLGLDNAGKTTLLKLLSSNRLGQFKPTRNATNAQITYKNTVFTAHDVGGHKEARKIWKDYFDGVDGIIYIIDTSDKKRLYETKDELNYVLLDETIVTKPILILGNKIDKNDAISEPQLRTLLGLQQTTGKGNVNVYKNTRPIEVFMCSLINREGYGEGFTWLAQYV